MAGMQGRWVLHFIKRHVYLELGTCVHNQYSVASAEPEIQLGLWEWHHIWGLS